MRHCYRLEGETSDSQFPKVAIENLFLDLRGSEASRDDSDDVRGLDGLLRTSLQVNKGLSASQILTATRSHPAAELQWLVAPVATTLTFNKPTNHCILMLCLRQYLHCLVYRHSARWALLKQQYIRVD